MTPEQYADAVCSCPRCGTLRDPHDVTEPQPDVVYVHLQCDQCFVTWRLDMVRSMKTNGLELMRLGVNV